MLTATAATTNMIAELSPQGRASLLGDLVKICVEEGTIERPRFLSDEKGRVSGYIVDFFPKSQSPPPDLTPEEVTELQRRIDSPTNRLAHDEFIVEIRRLRSVTGETK